MTGVYINIILCIYDKHSKETQTLFIVISQSDPAPLHRQVTDQIREAVAGGGLEPGERLPSIRELSKELKISPITIKRSYRDLEREGYIVTRPGLGSFVAEVDREEIREDKSADLRRELRRIACAAARYGISDSSLRKMLREVQEERDA